MKRWLFKLVVFLLLGAVMNVAVAWGVHLGSDRVSSLEIARIYSVVLTRVANTRWNRAEFSDILEISFGVTHRSVVFERVKQSERFRRLVGQVIVEVGWPMRTLYSTSYQYEGDQNWTQDAWTLALVPRTEEYGWTYGPELPLRPLWLGFGVNTVLFTSVSWGVALLLVASRRVIRRKRGHCIKCGYDLRGDFSAGCSECGWRRASETETAREKHRSNSPEEVPVVRAASRGGFPRVRIEPSGGGQLRRPCGGCTFTEVSLPLANC